MPTNVRDVDIENEKKVFNYLKFNFLPFSDLNYFQSKDTYDPFDFKLYDGSKHIISLDVKGCRMPYEKPNQFELSKASVVKNNSDKSHFIAYNYPDGKLKLVCLDNADLYEVVKVQKEHRSDRVLEKTVVVINEANTKDIWHFYSDSVKYLQ